MPDLTAPQRRALEALVAQTPDDRPTYPREVAMALWPDSPGWSKISRRGSTPAGGALGATMPMKAAALLWRLQRLGLATVEGDNQWRPTRAGRREVAGE